MSLKLDSFVRQGNAPDNDNARWRMESGGILLAGVRVGDTFDRIRLWDDRIQFGPGDSALNASILRNTSNGLLQTGSFQAGFVDLTNLTSRNSGLVFTNNQHRGIEQHYNGSWATALFTGSGEEIRFGRYAPSATAQNTMEVLGRFAPTGGLVLGTPTSVPSIITPGIGGINASNMWVNGYSVWHTGNFDPNSISTTRINLATWNDGNAVPGWAGFQPYWSTGGGGTNFPELVSPDQGGAGILVSRFADSTASKAGSFHLWSANNATSRLWFRKMINATTWTSWGRVWHSGDQGAGSTLDADMLDGLQASAFALVGDVVTIGTAQTITGAKQFTAVPVLSSASPGIRFFETGVAGDLWQITVDAETMHFSRHDRGSFVWLSNPYVFHGTNGMTCSRYTSNVANGTAPFTASSTTLCPNLNASLLGGKPASDFIDISATTQTKTGTLILGSGSSTGSAKLIVGGELAASSGAVAQFNGPIRVGYILTHSADGIFPATNNVGSVGASSFRYSNGWFTDLDLSGTLTARAPAGGSAAHSFLGVLLDPAATGRSVISRTAAQVRSDIGAAPVSHQHAAADVTSGVFAAARLGTGTASNTTFLRGDGAWATLGGASGVLTASADSTEVSGGSLNSGSTINVTGTARAGTSLTIPTSAMAVGSIIKVEARGTLGCNSGHLAVFRVVVGGLTVTFTIAEDDNWNGGTSGSVQPWIAEVTLRIPSSGSSVNPEITSHMHFTTKVSGSNISGLVISAYHTVSGSINTGIGQVVELQYAGTSDMTQFRRSHLVVWSI